MPLNSLSFPSLPSYILRSENALQELYLNDNGNNDENNNINDDDGHQEARFASSGPMKKILLTLYQLEQIGSLVHVPQTVNALQQYLSIEIGALAVQWIVSTLYSLRQEGTRIIIIINVDSPLIVILQGAVGRFGRS